MANKKRPINVLGVKLKQGREARGLSEQDAATRLVDYGITVKDISDYEKGFDLPDESKLSGMCEVYRINYNELLAILQEAKANDLNKNRTHPYKFVGRTFWEDFGDFIIKLIKISILVGIIFTIIKTGAIQKFMDYGKDENKTDENYIVDDEYLRMLNSKNGKKAVKFNEVYDK